MVWAHPCFVRVLGHIVGLHRIPASLELGCVLVAIVAFVFWLVAADFAGLA